MFIFKIPFVNHKILILKRGIWDTGFTLHVIGVGTGFPDRMTLNDGFTKILNP